MYSSDLIQEENEDEHQNVYKSGRGWAGEKSGLFEHPASEVSSNQERAGYSCSAVPIWLFRILLTPYRSGVGDWSPAVEVNGLTAFWSRPG